MQEVERERVASPIVLRCGYAALFALTANFQMDRTVCGHLDGYTRSDLGPRTGDHGN